MNCDVGFIEHNKYQVPVVVRNSEGKCLWWRVTQLTGQPQAVVGEGRAALKGVGLAIDFVLATII